MEQTEPLDATDETMRTQETALGHLVADAMRTLMGTDIAVWNSGAARSDAVSSTHALPVRSVTTSSQSFTLPIRILYRFTRACFDAKTCASCYPLRHMLES